MSRMLKGYIIEELKGRLTGADGIIFVNFEGMTVDTAEEFRGILADENLSMTIVKNSLAARACHELGMEGVAESLAGQVAFLYGENDGVVSVSRLLKDFTKKNKTIKVRGGIMDGAVLEAGDVKALADMPTRPEMIAKVVGQILSAGGNIAAALNGPGSKIAGCVEKHADNLEGGEAA